MFFFTFALTLLIHITKYKKNGKHMLKAVIYNLRNGFNKNVIKKRVFQNIIYILKF